MAKKTNPTPPATESALLSAEELITLSTLLGKLIDTQRTVSSEEPINTEAANDVPVKDDLDDDDGLGDEEETPKGPTVDDVREVLKKIVAAPGKGRELAKKILAKFGADSVTVLAEDKFQACINLANKQLAK